MQQRFLRSCLAAALVLAVAVTLVAAQEPSETTFVPFGERDLLDLLCTGAYFGFVSMILNTVRHPLPEGGVPLPPLPARQPETAAA